VGIWETLYDHVGKYGFMALSIWLWFDFVYV